MPKNVGKNVAVRMDGDNLLIAVDTKQRHGLSKSGKTTVVATTGGSRPVPGHDNLRYILTVYEKPGASTPTTEGEV